MTKEQIKQQFIESFGEEKWEIEEALDKLIPISINICKYLKVNELPIVVEPIEEDSRLNFKFECIILRKDIALNYLEALKALTHEYRHYYQFTCIKENRFEERLLQFYLEDFSKLQGKEQSTTDNYYSSIIEVDAFAFTKYYLKKEMNIETNYPNKEYDRILDFFIDKFYI